MTVNLLESTPENLLVLETRTGSSDAIAYMKGHGFWVVVTDDGDPVHPDKAGAEELARVSARDVEGLVRLTKGLGVDGVFSGVKDDNIALAVRVTEVLNLPYLCGLRQWQQVMEKARLRELSTSTGLPCPETFHVDDLEGLRAAQSGVRFPCIVKPVDNWTLLGISVCENVGSTPHWVVVRVSELRTRIHTWADARAPSCRSSVTEGWWLR